MTEEMLKDNFKIIPLNEIVTSKTNPRKTFNKDELDELSDSIKQHGVLQPIIVRPIGKHDYEIVSGERRYRACVLAQLGEIQAIIRDLDDEAVLEIQIIENLQRKEIAPLEEAEGFKKLIESQRYSYESLAEKIGKRAAYVHQRVKLTSLINKAKVELSEGNLSVGKALLLAKLDEKAQKQILNMSGFKSSTVSELKTDIQNNLMINLSTAVFDISDTKLVPAAGDCLMCDHNSNNSQTLFPEADEKDLCCNKKCFDEKVQAYVEKRLDDAEAAGEPLQKISSEFWYNGSKEENVLSPYHYTVFCPDNFEDGKTPKTKTAIIIDGENKGSEVQIIDNDNESIEAVDDEEDELTKEEELELINNQIGVNRARQLTEKLQFEIVTKAKKLTDLDIQHLALLTLENMDLDVLFDEYKILDREAHTNDEGAITIDCSALNIKTLVKIILAEQVEEWELKDSLEEKAVKHGINVKKIKSKIDEELPLKTLEDLEQEA